ncbi:MAG: polyprenyl synthetase family protein [Ignavibacteriales bacterium]|nr:polyprenyl synthetase family protein [Ignavibacteriales bacterium]
MNNQKFNKIYSTQRKRVDNKFETLLKGKSPASLYQPCEYIIIGGGKRLRSFLVMLSAFAVGGKMDSVFNASLSVELLHNFTLVHDDIMDNSDKRRGQPTLHKKYDVSTAILAGDSLIALAYKYLLKDCHDNNIKRVVEIFTNGVIEVCEGQSYDKEFETKTNVNIKDYLLMIKKKTAILLQTCCEIGAVLGNGDEKEIKALSNYGLNLGMAFQLQDDYLDIFGDESEFGKSVGSDLVEGKKTFLFLKAIEKAKGKDLGSIKYILKNNGIERNQIPEYKNLYLKLNVNKEIEKEISKYTKRALGALKILHDDKSKNILIWLANQLLNRKS